MVITKEQIRDWLIKLAEVFVENKTYLTELDSPIGDADHGNNMSRGFNAVAEKVAGSEADIGSLFKTTGMTLISTVGGASGPLYGTFFLDSAKLGQKKIEVTAIELASMIEQGVHGVIRRGRAELGDKTMIDAWVPATKAFKTSAEAGNDLISALNAAVAAAEAGMKETSTMLAKKGRASYLGERSIGHQDPGATSAFLMLKTLAEVVAG